VPPAAPVPAAIAQATAPSPASGSPPTPADADESPAVDHAEELFHAMHALSLFESAPAGARFCLEVALSSVPCMAALVHLRDPSARDLVVVHAEGPRAEALIGTRTPPTDALVTSAIAKGKPKVVAYGTDPGASDTAACPRHAFFDPWSVAVVPVVVGGQLLALLEMIDPLDGKPFDKLSRGALAYIAGRLGRFLADRGA
jgi:hypothetical protein